MPFALSTENNCKECALSEKDDFGALAVVYKEETDDDNEDKEA